MNLNRPHDTFFKQLMTDPVVLRDFLEIVLPKDVISRLDLNSLEIIDTEKANRKYKKYYLDLSAQCKLENEPGELYLIFEHKSYPDKLTLVQILNYMAVVFEQDLANGKDPRPILPIVFYHGRTKFSLPTSFRDYFKVSDDLKKYLLDFRIFLFDTCNYKNEDLLKFSQNAYLTAAFLLFKNIFKDFKDLKPVLKQVLKIKTDKVEYLLNYVVMAKDIDEKELTQVLQEIGGELMPSLAQRWLEQGKQIGLQQGVQMGLEQGLILEGQEMVLELLNSKFSTIPVQLEQTIKQISDRNLLKKLLRLGLQAADLKEFELKLLNIKNSYKQ